MTSNALDVTIITGMSGAGRSAAADVLEDLGFFVIDNLPPALIAKVAELARGTRSPQRFALVVDVRSGEFLDDLGAALDELRASGRAHPGAVPRRGRRRARAPLRGDAAATRSRPTTASPTASRASARCSKSSRARPTSSSTRRTSTCTSCATGCASCSPTATARRRAADRASCRSATSTASRSTSTSCSTAASCPNPHWVDELRPLPGTDAAVRDYVLGAARRRARSSTSSSGCSRCCCPAYVREGKAYLSIGVGCTGGRHRSVVIAARARRRCSSGSGYPPRVHHRDLDRELTLDPTAPRSSRSAAGTGSRSRCAAIRQYAGVDHRGRQRRRRRRLVGPAPARPRRARRPATCAGASSRSPTTTACGRPRSSTASRGGELDGHALGNLVLVGLAETLGDFTAALDEAGRLLGAVGRVLPGDDRAGRR